MLDKMSCCGRFVCTINPGPPIELNLDSEGGIHIPLAALNYRVFLADSNEDIETQRKMEKLGEICGPFQSGQIQKRTQVVVLSCSVDLSDLYPNI